MSQFTVLHRCTLSTNFVKWRTLLLGAKLDSNLTFDNHTKSVSRSCFYHIRTLRQIRGALDNSTATTVASALVSARLDYVNSILYNLQFGSRSFCASAPTLWNSLPCSVRFCESLTTFRKHLKTFYFQSAFPGAP